MPNMISFLSRVYLPKPEATRIRRCVLGAVLAFCLLATATSTSPGSADPKLYLNDIKTLSAPEMEGRGAGTKGLTQASQYLERRYQALGLQPAGTNGYLQPFTVTTGAELKSDNRLSEEMGGKKRALLLHQEFVPASFSSSGSFTGPVVFAGYGASADEFHYDDYAGTDVKDKIVVVLRYEPAI